MNLYRFKDEYEESGFFVELDSYFQERKIKKMVFTEDAIENSNYFGLLKELRKRYELIADELVLHHNYELHSWVLLRWVELQREY